VGIGGSAANYVVVRNINVTAGGSYKLTVWGISLNPATYSLSVNGGAPFSLTLDGPDSITPVAATATITLNSGSNTIKIYNDTAAAPQLDRIKVVPTP
jgi:Carbohydrate binding module (family 35)